MTPFRRPLDYWLLWLVALGSLAVNVWLIITLLRARSLAAQSIAQAARLLGDVQTQSFTYNVHIEENVPFSTTVEFSDTFTVPINTVIPVRTTVYVPVTIPIIGVLATLPVPIDTTVPVNLTVEVPIDKQILVEGNSPISFDVPVEIAISATPFGAALGEAHDWLVELAAELGAKTN